jgi:hypothetical protein
VSEAGRILTRSLVNIPNRNDSRLFYASEIRRNPMSHKTIEDEAEDLHALFALTFNHAEKIEESLTAMLIQVKALKMEAKIGWEKLKGDPSQYKEKLV